MSKVGGTLYNRPKALRISVTIPVVVPATAGALLQEPDGKLLLEWAVATNDSLGVEVGGSLLSEGSDLLLLDEDIISGYAILLED